MKNAHFRSFSGPYFLEFGLNTTEKTPILDTFHVVWYYYVDQEIFAIFYSEIFLEAQKYQNL